MRKKVVQKPQRQLIYGIHSIVELLKAKKRKLFALYTTKPVPKAFAQIEALLPAYPVSMNYVSREQLHRLADTTDHQSVVGLAAPFVHRKQFFEPQKQSFLLMLDGIQDVRNLGAILRTAYCTGVQGVIITKKKSAPLNAAALKASAGLAEHLEIYKAPSAQAAALQLKQGGYQLYITGFKGTNALEMSYQKPLCLVIGSEATGVSPALFAYGIQITLPQRTSDISYNASVAAGILLFLIAFGRLR